LPSFLKIPSLLTKHSDDIIALQLERSEWMVIAILGIMKAGAAYLPIAPDAPKTRTAFMLQDAKVKVLLTDKGTFPIATEQQNILSVEVVENIKMDAVHRPPSTVHRLPSSLAYIIYTSGSTGNPKGVMIEQEALSNLCAYIIRDYEIGTNDTILQFANYTFDVSVEEMFPCLVAGASLYLRNDEMIQSSNLFFDVCETHQITILNLPPVFWSELTNSIHQKEVQLPNCIKLVLVGGEALSVTTINQWFESATTNTRLINAYGPTETTVNATMFVFEKPLLNQTIVPIGQPVMNTEVFILNEALRKENESIKQAT